MPSLQRVDRGAALVEAERPLADDFGMNADRLLDVVGLLLGRRVAVVDPFVAVSGDLPARLLHRRGDFGIARQRGGDREDGHRDVALGEHAMQPPETGARAVFVDQLHVHVALARPGRGADDLRQERLGGEVAMQNVVLAALFVIDHELQRDPRPARPIRERRRAAVSSHVARVFLLHLTPPERARLARYDRRRTYDGRAVGSKGRFDFNPD